jgi:serine/threonine protein kinase
MQYAVKVFYYSSYPPSEVSGRVNNFKKEARMLKFLSQRSRHFIFLVDYEYNPYENIGYMIMELGDGSLRHFLVGAPLPDAQRKYYWKQIVTILKDLQDAHVGKKYIEEYLFLSFSFKVHADIKPDNMVMVNNVIKVTDLGLSFRMSSPNSTTRRQGVRGTLGKRIR